MRRAWDCQNSGAQRKTSYRQHIGEFGVHAHSAGRHIMCDSYEHPRASVHMARKPEADQVPMHVATVLTCCRQELRKLRRRRMWACLVAEAPDSPSATYATQSDSPQSIATPDNTLTPPAPQDPALVGYILISISQVRG